jgi:hypothetical protein
MNERELYNEINLDFNFELPDLFKAILEESCENACKSNVNENDKKSAALVAFATALSALKGLIIAALKQADIINLNYRNQSFQIDHRHPIMKFDMSKMI